MSTQPRRAAWAALMLASTLLAACAATPTPSPTSAPATPTLMPIPTAQPSPAKVLRWAMVGAPEAAGRLDPARVASRSSAVIAQLVFEGLVRLDTDLSAAPGAADMWSVLDEGRTYVFNIRPGLKFGDGSPASADDVAFSLQRALSSGVARGPLANVVGVNEVLAGQASSVQGVRVLSPLSLEIRLLAPDARFLEKLAFVGLAIVPRQAESPASAWQQRPFGTGPFLVQDPGPADALRLVPNPHYWGESAQVDAIEITFYTDALPALDAYRAGQHDLVSQYEYFARGLSALAEHPDLYAGEPLDLAYLGFNHHQPPFDDVRVRQAFAKAVDRGELLRRLENAALRQADTLLPASVPGFNPVARIQAFDPEAAQLLLAEAGYPAGAAFPPSTLLVDEGDAAQALVAAALLEMWSTELGVDVMLVALDRATYRARLREAAGQGASDAPAMFLAEWFAAYADPAAYLSDALRVGLPDNFGRYASDPFDQLTGQADASADDEERLELYRQAEQIALDDVAWLPLYHLAPSVLVRPTVSGLTPAALSGFASPDWSRVRVQP